MVEQLEPGDYTSRHLPMVAARYVKVYRFMRVLHNGCPAPCKTLLIDDGRSPGTLV